MNEILNVDLIGIALSDTEGEAELEIHGSPTWAKLDTSADTAFKRGSDVADRVRVTLSTIDAQLSRVAAPDLVKLDIEGAEVAALRGASKLLTEHRPTLICELHGTSRAVTELLQSHDYDLRSIETPEIPSQQAEWYVHVLATPRGSS